MITGNLISQGTGIENMNVGNNGLEYMEKALEMSLLICQILQ